MGGSPAPYDVRDSLLETGVTEENGVKESYQNI